MEEASRRRHRESFMQEAILRTYEELLLRFSHEDEGPLRSKPSTPVAEKDLSVIADRESAVDSSVLSIENLNAMGKGLR
jgi:hypothetical protein